MPERSDSFAGTVTLGERGQVVIPAHVRHALRMSPGQRLVVLKPPGAPMLCLVGIENVEAALAALALVCPTANAASESCGDPTSAAETAEK
ncbi:MAG TPA: AbrB/MazE/SpoVT family DNA-binding domain-containing protein [Armatimonadota bacterium]|jgi:AbrB family looped-hinge helix DNA binding protein